MVKKRSGHILKAILFIVLFLVEYLVLVYFDNKLIVTIDYILLAINICLFISLITAKKTNHFSSFVFKIFKNIAGNILGIIAIIYFTTHIGWIFTALRESYSDICLLTQVYLYLNFLFFPYLLLTFFISKNDKKVSPKDRRVLLTSVSIFDRNRKTAGKLSEFEINVLKTISSKDDFYSWGVSVNWQPIFLAISEFEELDEVIILNTKETNYANEAIKNSSEFNEYTIRKLIKQYFPKIKVTEITIEKPNEIQSTVEDINFLLRKKLKKYSDQEIVFSITSGTAAVTAAMAMVAVKGDRGIVYLDQQRNITINNSIDVFDIKELWEEIIDKYE